MTETTLLKAQKQAQRRFATIEVIVLTIVAFVIGLAVVLVFDLQLTIAMFEDGSFVSQISGCLPWELCN